MMRPSAEDEEIAAAAAAALGDVEPEAEPELKCDICGAPMRTKRGLAMHKRFHRPAERQAPAARPSAPESVVNAVVEEATANAIVIGGYLSIVFPHLGTAIAGVPSDDPEQPVVRSRAQMAAGILREHAQRNPRVLAALERFNQLFKSTELVEIAGGLAAAAAVDVGVVDPHLALEVGPFRGESAIRPVQAVIGDVVDYVDQVRAQQQASNGAGASYPQSDEVAPDGARVVRGGVEDT